ncbi:hypothetical protein R1sor_011748 [Riccia sorocarpa]|uniref:Uncharacterized protein n=1 Tax=Riccia sorocarpa TaxID=122646 RepID=A0ABD3I4H0_9MARC
MGSEAAPDTEFHLTGFKKFHNVAENPTETLVTRAMQYMKNNPLPYGTEIKTCTILETAGVGALDDLLGKFDEALLGKKNPAHNGGVLDGDKEVEASRQESPVVWIHLGVNSGATRFAVEQRAVNEATFRCPDEMGWQPDHLPIVAEDGDITAVRESKFAVGKIVCSLVNQGFDVVVSNDAGRKADGIPLCSSQSCGVLQRVLIERTSHILCFHLLPSALYRDC